MILMTDNIKSNELPIIAPNFPSNRFFDHQRILEVSREGGPSQIIIYVKRYILSMVICTVHKYRKGSSDFVT